MCVGRSRVPNEGKRSRDLLRSSVRSRSTSARIGKSNKPEQVKMEKIADDCVDVDPFFRILDFRLATAVVFCVLSSRTRPHALWLCFSCSNFEFGSLNRPRPMHSSKHFCVKGRESRRSEKETTEREKGGGNAG